MGEAQGVTGRPLGCMLEAPGREVLCASLTSFWPPHWRAMTEQLIGWAANGEDVVLWRALKGRSPGYFVDVGACDPVADSVTQLFSLNGWIGINIEPQPPLAALLAASRPNDVNLAAGVSDEPGVLELHVVDDDVQRTTFSSELAEIYRDEGRRVTLHRVPVMTLNKILEDHPLPRIDFLKIDAEGFEDRVVGGLDLSLHRPSVIVAEHADWLNCKFPHVLEAAGYRQVLFDGVNRYFVAKEDDEELGAALSYPACALDRWVPVGLVDARMERDAAQAAARIAQSQLDLANDQLLQAKDHLVQIHASESWRVGQAVSRMAAPFVKLWRRRSAE